MGNAFSRGRRRSNSRRSHPPPPPPSQLEINVNRYVFAAAARYLDQFPHGPSYYPYPEYYPPPYVEHQKAVTIPNDVHLKKETLRIEPDEHNPGKYLVAFTFDAIVSGRCIRPSHSYAHCGKEERKKVHIISLRYEQLREVEDCLLTPMKESLLPPITVEFQQGLSQKFRQPSGTGVDLSMFDEAESSKDGDADVYPLAVKEEAIQGRESVSEDANATSGSTNSQLTLAVFGKDKGEHHVRVVKQILWVNGMRYELEEIDTDFDGNDPGKECVICFSEPRDTTVLPCRHMWLCQSLEDPDK